MSRVWALWISIVVALSLVAAALVGMLLFVPDRLVTLFVVTQSETDRISPPSDAAVYVRGNRDVVAVGVPDWKPAVLRLTPRAVAYRSGSSGDMTEVTVFGWIWSPSPAGHDGTKKLAEGAAALQMMPRADNCPAIVSALPTAELTPLYSGQDRRWCLYRTTGWVKSSLLTSDEQSRHSTQSLLPTDTRPPGVLSAGEKVTRFAESATALVILMVGVSMLWLTVLRWHRGITQIHIGSGDNVAGKKEHEDGAQSAGDA